LRYKSATELIFRVSRQKDGKVFDGIGFSHEANIQWKLFFVNKTKKKKKKKRLGQQKAKRALKVW
jgi:hypothetical protein